MNAHIDRAGEDDKGVSKQSMYGAVESAGLPNLTVRVRLGLAPGLMTVLAKELVRCGARGELHIVLTLDLIGRHGEEAIAWTLAQLRAAAGFVRGPRGNKLYPVDFADNSAIAAWLGLDAASAYLALRPDLPAIDLASLYLRMCGTGR